MSKAALLSFETYLLTERRVSPHTFDAYKKDVAQFLKFLESNNIKFETVTQIQLKEFLGYLEEKKITARTRSRKISSLKAFFLYSSRTLGIVNSAQELMFPKVEKRLPQYLTEREMKCLFRISDRDTSSYGVRNKIMLYLLYVSGVRVTEMVNLCLSDIHFDTGLISVMGKGGKGRMIPIPHLMLELLQEYITTTRSVLLRNFKMTTEYLFPTCYKKKLKPISRQSCWLILRNLCKQAKITKNISPHKLRHSFATHMLKRGADLRSLQLLLGHENLSTVQIYTHVETSYLRKIYDKKHPRS